MDCRRHASTFEHSGVERAALRVSRNLWSWPDALTFSPNVGKHRPRCRRGEHKVAVQIKAAGMVAGMGDADLLHAAMHRTGDFGLLRFLPAATLAVASAAAGPERCAVP